MEKPEIHIIDMAEQIEQLIDRLAGPTYMSALYMDLEGVNLCRDGSISIITLLVDSSTSRERIYILNVHTLGTLKFDTAGTVTGKTLRGVLQDEEVEKNILRRPQRFGRAVRPLRRSPARCGRCSADGECRKVGYSIQDVL
jgi:hypothetical protein